MSAFHLKIASPDGKIFEGEVTSVSLRGVAGDLAILANHAPFITGVSPCICKIALPDGGEKQANIGGGILSVDGGETRLMSHSFNWI